MTLAEMVAELNLYTNNDPHLATFFVGWINRAVASIASDFELPSLKRLSPYSVTVTTADWLYDLPEDFQKKLFLCCDGDYTKIQIMRDVEEVTALDLDHDETGTHVLCIAENGTQFAVYPKASETLKLWYYSKPVYISGMTDSPTCIPSQYHSSVILPKVILQNAELLQYVLEEAPNASLMYWQEKYKQGLYGTPRGDIGMVNFLAKRKAPIR